MIDPSPPRWRSIFSLFGVALAILVATHWFGSKDGDLTRLPLRSKHAGREGPRSAAVGVGGSSSVGPQARATSREGPSSAAPGPLASEGGLLGPDPSTHTPATHTPEGDAPSPAPAGAGEPTAAERAIPQLAKELGRAVDVVNVQVIDPSGNPLAGVQVQLGDRGATTDSLGECVLPQATADLVIRRPESLPKILDPETRRGIALRGPDREGERVVVVLFPGGRIAGRVQDSAGKSIADVQVFLDGSEEPETVSDAQGEFRSATLRPGVHAVHLKHASYQRADAPVSIPTSGGEVRFTAVLSPGVPIQVRAVDPEGRAVPDAAVWLVRRLRGGAEESRYSGRTGDDGRLALLWNPADPHSVRILVPGFREAVRPLLTDPSIVPLERAPLLAGQFIEKDRGLPVRPTDVTLEVETADGFSRAPDRGILFRTLSAGKFKVGLPPFAGRYRIRAQAEGDLRGISELVHFDGQSDPPAVTVYLERRTGLRGQVVAARSSPRPEPVPGARVELHRHDLTESLRLAYGIWFSALPSPAATGSSDAAGGFSFPDLRPSVYRVRIVHPRFAEWLSAPVVVPLDAPLSCSLREGGTLRGTVLDPQGAPQESVPLILATQSHPFPRFTRSDAEGKYEFQNLAEGSYVLLPGDSGAASGLATETRWSQPGAARIPLGGQAVQVQSGGDVIFDVRRTETRLGSISGSVSTDGAPMAGVSLRVTPVSAKPIPASGDGSPSSVRQPPLDLEITTGPDGGFRLDGLEPGAYRIQGGGVPIESTVDVRGGKTAEMAVGLRTLTYQAVLLDGLHGKPIESGGRAEIYPERRGKDPSDARRKKSEERKDAGGQVAIEGGRLVATGLFPGAYRVRIEVPGYIPYEGRIAIEEKAAGGTVAQELRLEPGNTIRVAVKGLDDAPYRGPAETVLLRDQVEIHRNYGVVDGAVLLPVLPAGTYTLTIRTENASARMRIDVASDGELNARLKG